LVRHCAARRLRVYADFLPYSRLVRVRRFGTPRTEGAELACGPRTMTDHRKASITAGGVKDRRRVSAASSCPPTVIMIIIVVIMTGTQQRVSGYRPYPDPGPDILQWQRFCAGRPPGDRCCPNRIDSCTVPILDTLCYCDEFCDRTISDCCPDFWSECRGLSPQPFNLSTTPRPPFTSLYILSSTMHAVYNTPYSTQ